MVALVDNTVLEAEISECLQAIYQATDQKTAMKLWNKLSALKEQRVESEDRLFQLESQGLSKHRVATAIKDLS